MGCGETRTLGHLSQTLCICALHLAGLVARGEDETSDGFSHKKARVAARALRAAVTGNPNCVFYERLRRSIRAREPNRPPGLSGFAGFQKRLSDLRPAS